MSGPCYSAEVAQAVHNVTLVFWALLALLAIAGAAAFSVDRWRPR